MTRVLAWVRALTRGRRRVLARGPRPAMVLAARARVRAVTNVSGDRHHHHHRHLTLAHTVVAGARAVRPAGSVTRLLRAHTVERHGGTPGARGSAGPALGLAATPSPTVAAAAISATVEQLAAAHRRVESHAPPRLRALPVAPREPAPQIATPGGRLPALPDAPRRPESAALRSPAVPADAADPAPAMVVRRPPAAVAQAAAQAAVAAAATAPAGRELVSPRHPAAAPALNVEELTDRVVAQIDRRITAHRERLGQL